MENALALANLMGCPFYGVYDDRNRIQAYGIDSAHYKKTFGLNQHGKILQCINYDDASKMIHMCVLDHHVFSKLYNYNAQKILQVCIAQLAIFA